MKMGEFRRLTTAVPDNYELQLIERHPSDPEVGRVSDVATVSIRVATPGLVMVKAAS